MWSHAQSALRCPTCRSELRLHPLDVETADFGKIQRQWIGRGALECEPCGVAYPIDSGVPVMLTYETAVAKEAAAGCGGAPQPAAGFPSQAMGLDLAGNECSARWAMTHPTAQQPRLCS